RLADDVLRRAEEARELLGTAAELVVTERTVRHNARLDDVPDGLARYGRVGERCDRWCGGTGMAAVRARRRLAPRRRGRRGGRAVRRARRPDRASTARLARARRHAARARGDRHRSAQPRYGGGVHDTDRRPRRKTEKLRRASLSVRSAVRCERSLAAPAWIQPDE